MSPLLLALVLGPASPLCGQVVHADQRPRLLERLCCRPQQQQQAPAPAGPDPATIAALNTVLANQAQMMALLGRIQGQQSAPATPSSPQIVAPIVVPQASPGASPIGYAPQPLPQGYAPQTLPQGYTPQPLPQGYAPQTLPQGYSPQALPGTYNPQIIVNPGTTPQALPQGATPQALPQGYTPQAVPRAAPSSPPGFDLRYYQPTPAPYYPSPYMPPATSARNGSTQPPAGVPQVYTRLAREPRR